MTFIILMNNVITLTLLQVKSLARQSCPNCSVHCQCRGPRGGIMCLFLLSVYFVTKELRNRCCFIKSINYIVEFRFSEKFPCGLPITKFASTLCLKPIYIEKAKLLLCFCDGKRNSYRLEILIWCNKDRGYVFVCQRRYCILFSWQIS